MLVRSRVFVAATLWSGWDSETRDPRASPGFWTLAENAGTTLLAPVRNGMEWKGQVRGESAVERRGE